MKKRLGIVIAALIGALILGLMLWSLAQPQEPMYQGKSLGYWLDQQAQGRNLYAAYTAIETIGVEAVPVVMVKCRQHSSHWHRFCGQVWAKLPGFMRRRLRDPERSGFSFPHASQSLPLIGPRVVPAIAPYLRDDHLAVRTLALSVLSFGRLKGYDLTAAIPELVHALNDPDGEMQRAAVHLLAEVGSAAQPAIAALTAVLRRKNWGTNPLVRIDFQKTVAKALGKIGSPAQAAMRGTGVP